MRNGDPGPETDRSAKKLYVYGAVGTVAYILIQVIYSWSMWDVLVAMKPADYASFLAGLVSPLAFLWLVLGFIQQGTELRNSGRALWLQGEELRASVEQSKELVNVSRQHLTHELELAEAKSKAERRSSQPIFRVKNLEPGFYADGSARFSYKLTNSGNRCTDVNISSDSLKSGGEGFGFRPAFDCGESIDIALFYRPTVSRDPFEIKIAFLDTYGEPQEVVFETSLETIRDHTIIKAAVKPKVGN